MRKILCLAHFCEVHGPTPLMVTEGLPVKCSSCDDHNVPELIAAVASVVSSVTSSPSSTSTPHAAATAATVAVADAFRKMTLGQPSNSRNLPPISTGASADGGLSRSSADIPTPRSRPDTTSAPRRSPRTSTSPKDLPQTQRSQAQPIPSQPARSDVPTSNFRKTYDDSVTKRAIPCDNCAMTLPRRKTAESSASSTTGNNNGTSGGTDARNPTLRTRVPCARVYDRTSGDASPRLFHPSSSSASSSTSSDTEGDDRPSAHLYRNHHRRTGTMTSVGTSRSSTSSSASHLMGSHDHYLDYTSTHEPVSANAYCIIRASCLRTLTLETLPRSPATGGSMLVTTSQPTTPSPLAATSYFTSSPHSAASASAAAAAAANGGPLFFGDPAAGYTTAHVFRVADMHARGHKRVYALIALNTHRERMAMKAFGFVSAAFNDLAIWIQQMADAEAERVALHNESTATSSPSGDGSPSTNTNPAFGFDRSPHVSPPPTQPSSVTNDSGSSFLVAAGNGLSRRMGPGFAGYGGLGSSAAASLRARGLPEILGMPDFFIELHARFVRLLLELGMALKQ
ncbi:hypothetical protein SEUCBS139899_008394 [Sporothrix eucalyptigena]